MIPEHVNFKKMFSAGNENEGIDMNDKGTMRMIRKGAKTRWKNISSKKKWSLLWKKLEILSAPLQKTAQLL